MTEISQRISNLSVEQRALLEKRIAVGAPVRTREPVAIIGAACRLPGEANDLAAFWRLLCDGVDGITLVPRERWDAEGLFDPNPSAAGKICSRWGGFISGADRFDAAFFGISPREAVEMDPQQRIMLEVAHDALDHAGIAREQLLGTRMGIFVGVHGHASDYLLLQNTNLDALDSFSGTGAAHNLLAGRLSYLLDTHGPAMVIDTACSSSLVALHLAVQSLRLEESSSALVGGVNLILTPNFTIAASRMHMLAPDGRCKAFDCRADGFVRSEGCGVVVLKRLSDALANRDAILAVIRGSAINQDGHTNGITAPNGLAQRRVIEQALADAGVTGDQIGFVEAHGTGTALGDPIEIEALSATIGVSNRDAEPCYVGSVKTNIGHLEGAAGIAGLIKASLVLKHGEIPPNLHFMELNPHIKIAGTRLKFPQSVETWKRTNTPRLASVSSFGWSGTNAHVIMEEPPAAAARLQAPAHNVRVLPISARSSEALAAMTQRMRDRLRDNLPIDIDDLCFTAAVRRSHHEYRIAAVGRSVTDLADSIDAALEKQIAAANWSAAPRIAFVFPGHGAQWSGMGRSLLGTEPAFRDAIIRCDAAIRDEAGWSLLEQIQSPPDATRINDVQIAQPALFAFGVALAELWTSWGITPGAVIGHSMGEIGAAHVAGAISLEDATRIICRRSRLLQQVADQGGMLLVELSQEDAQQAIAAFEGQLSIGAVNGPRSTVLAGDHGALERISATLTARDIFCRIVKGSPPGHSHHVEPFVRTLRADVAAVQPRMARIPIYSTVTAEAQRGELFDAHYWVRNFREPVRFLDAVRGLLRDGFDTLIEMSPHPILLSTVRDIVAAVPGRRFGTDDDDSREAIALPSLSRDDDDHEVLYDSLGRLYEQGAAVQWTKIAPKSGRVVALPSYAWQRQRYWLERAPMRPQDAVPNNKSRDIAETSNRQLADVTEWLYEASWTKVERICSGRASGHWIVLANKGVSAAFAAELEANLKATGGAAHIIFGDDNAGRALELARTGATLWSGIIHCASLDATPNEKITIASLSGDPVPGSRSLLDAVRTLDADLWIGEPKLWIVTRGAAAVHEADRADLAIAQAPMSGLARVVQAEHPTRFAAWLDLDPFATLGNQAIEMVTELVRNDNEPTVAIRGSGRYVQRLAPFATRATKRTVTFRPNAGYLITGGLGGIGLFVARWMIASGARHLLVIGRTSLPPRSQWRKLSEDPASPVNARIAAIRELESLGASVHYEAANVGDADAMSAVLERWRSDARPPIRGIIHTAAVIDDQLLTELKPRLIDEVFRAKAVGAWVLHSAVPDADWMVLFSSLASIWPAPGHANYSAANAFLDALAHYRSGNGRHGLSVSWGLWTDIGFAATTGGREAARRFAEQGIHGFSPAQGLRALDVLLEHPVAHAAVLNADRDGLAGRHDDAEIWPLLRGFARPGRQGARGDLSDAFVEQLRRADSKARVTLLQQCISKHVEEILKLEKVWLEVQKPLGEYGLNSIMGLELRHRLERNLALRLPATLVFNYPTVAAMAEHLRTRLDPAPTRADGISRSKQDPQIHAEPPVSPSVALAASRVGARVAQLEELSDKAALAALRAPKAGEKR